MTVRLKRRAGREGALKVASLAATVRDFEQLALDLGQQIAAEEVRTGITDPVHVAYSMFAKAARLRQSNLVITISKLTARLDVARREQEALTEELRQLEPPEVRDPRAMQQSR